MKGSCLCQSVSIEANDIDEFTACHCGMCRKWGGGAYLAVHCGSGLTITGETSIKSYASSEWANRAFCKNCGTHLFYYLKPASEYMVSLGLFDESKKLNFAQEIYIDHKPDYYSFSDATEKLTEKEVLEQFGS